MALAQQLVFGDSFRSGRRYNDDTHQAADYSPENPFHTHADGSLSFAGTREQAREFWIGGQGGSAEEINAAMRRWRPHPNDLITAYQSRREAGLENYGQGLLADLDFNYANAMNRSQANAIGRGLGNSTWALGQDRKVDSTYMRDLMAIRDRQFLARQGVFDAGQNVGGTLANARAASSAAGDARDAETAGQIGAVVGGIFGPAGAAVGQQAGTTLAKSSTDTTQRYGADSYDYFNKPSSYKFQFKNNTRTPVRNTYQRA